MTDEFRASDAEPMSDAMRGDLAHRGTALSLALGFETLTDRAACAMRAPFRADLVGDPEGGGLAGGVIIALLDQTCGMAISFALRGRAEPERARAAAGRHGDAGLPPRLHPPAARRRRGDRARPSAYSLAGDVALVRGWAYEDDRADPIAAAQAAFMITHLPPEQLAEARLAWDAPAGATMSEASPHRRAAGRLALRALPRRAAEAGEAGPIAVLPFAAAADRQPDPAGAARRRGRLFLELAALAQLDAAGRRARTIDITVDYLRPARPVTFYAQARILKLGRRAANLEVEAWQENRESPVAALRGHFMILWDNPSIAAPARIPSMV